MTLGLGAARACDPERYRLGGAAPRVALRPASRAELSGALAAASRDGLAVIPWGGGVSLGAAGAAPQRYDLALDLTAFNRVVEYEPEDFTLTAECGVTIARLRSQLAARGQELPLEAAFAGRATLGGVLAADASGPRRARFGSPRDRILGARFVLVDGTLVHTGGKVVKNVAGYAIHRLLCGSRGGLALIVEASLKLAPAPHRRTALIYRAGADELRDAARWAAFGRLEPAFLSVVGEAAAARLPLDSPRGGFTVVVGLEDHVPWVQRQTAATVAALGEPAARLEGESVTTLAQGLADLEEADRGPRLSFSTAQRSPDALAPLLDRPLAAGLVFHAAAGRLHCFPGADAQEAANLAAGHGFVLLGARGAEVEASIAPEAALAPLRSRVREALDPRRVLALGDRWERGEL